MQQVKDVVSQLKVGGRSQAALFENDGYLSPIHAQLDVRGPTAVVRDLDGDRVAALVQLELARPQIFSMALFSSLSDALEAAAERLCVAVLMEQVPASAANPADMWTTVPPAKITAGA